MAALPREPFDLQALAQRATQGDRPAVEELLARFLPRLRAFVRLHLDSALRQRESCSDIVQSACREALDHAGGFRYEGEEQFRAWLFRAALHKILERRRHLLAQKRDARRETVLGDLDAQDVRMALQSPSQMAIAGELAAEMEAAFDRLPADYREVITLTRIVQLSHAETARQMGRTEGAVRMLLSRALLAYVAAIDAVRRGR